MEGQCSKNEHVMLGETRAAHRSDETRFLAKPMMPRCSRSALPSRVRDMYVPLSPCRRIDFLPMEGEGGGA